MTCFVYKTRPKFLYMIVIIQSVALYSTFYNVEHILFKAYYMKGTFSFAKANERSILNYCKYLLNNVFLLYTENRL